MQRRDQRDRRAGEVGEVGHVVVERLERALRRVDQHFIQTSFRFAGEDGDAHLARAVEIGIFALQHAEDARSVEAADGDLDAARAQRTGDVERARELVRLHADQHDHPAAGRLDHPRQRFRPHALIGLIVGVNLHLHVVAEDLALVAVARQAVKRGEGVRGNGGAVPLDDVAVVVVVRRLDQQQAEAAAHLRVG